MKKLVFLTLLVLSVSTPVCGQEKVEGPVWNTGDKWIFTGDGSIEVIKMGQSGYTLKFSDGNCLFETKAYNTILFEKSTLNRIKAVEGDKLRNYTMGLRKILNFPLSIGKQWNYGYSAALVLGGHAMAFDYCENYTVLAWEEIEVQAGKFKALKLEYKRLASGSSGWGGIGEEIKNQYWYSPDAKYFVKCQYDKDWMKGKKQIFNWELISFQLKN